MAEGIGYVIAIAIFIVGFLFPTLIGIVRKRRDISSIALMNVLLGGLIIGWVIALVWAFKKDKPEDKLPTHICGTCGSQVRPIDITPGTTGMELLLWLLFLLPGVIYSVWRLITRHAVCPICQSSNLIPLGTLAANALVEHFKLSGAAVKGAIATLFICLCTAGTFAQEQKPCPISPGVYVMEDGLWQALQLIHPVKLELGKWSGQWLFSTRGIIATFRNGESPFRVMSNSPAFCSVDVVSSPDSLSLVALKANGKKRMALVAMPQTWTGGAKHDKAFQPDMYVRLITRQEGKGTYRFSPETALPSAEYILFTSVPDVFPKGWKFDPHMVNGYDFGYFEH